MAAATIVVILVVFWAIRARRSIRIIYGRFPQAFPLALIMAVGVVVFSCNHTLWPPREPVGGDADAYNVWAAQSTAAYARTMVVLLVLTAGYGVTTLGLLWQTFGRSDNQHLGHTDPIDQASD